MERLYNTVTKIYSYRSKVVHGNNKSNKLNKSENEKIVQDAYVLVKKCIEKIIENKKYAEETSSEKRFNMIIEDMLLAMDNKF